jgi:putative exosortase-associated protein (TIGR04073 family)
MVSPSQTFLIIVVAKLGTNLLIESRCMKNHFALLVLAAFSITGSAIADIQSPPGHHYTWSGKLTRGVGNIAFAPGEYITRWRMALKDRGPVAGLTEGLVEGTHRSIVRLFYGVYEVATCPVPSWKQTYRPPYPSRETPTS